MILFISAGLFYLWLTVLFISSACVLFFYFICEVEHMHCLSFFIASQPNTEACRTNAFDILFLLDIPFNPTEWAKDDGKKCPTHMHQLQARDRCMSVNELVNCHVFGIIMCSQRKHHQHQHTQTLHTSTGTGYWADIGRPFMEPCLTFFLSVNRIQLCFMTLFVFH